MNLTLNLVHWNPIMLVSDYTAVGTVRLAIGYHMLKSALQLSITVFFPCLDR